MASVNKVILVGNLGADPEVRYFPDGTAFVNLSLATTSNWKDKASGEKREETEWHRVVLRGRPAEVVGEYCRKGSSLYVEGKLKTRKWTDKEGVERFTTEIQGDNLQLLGGRGGSGGAPSGGSASMGGDDFDTGESYGGGGGGRSGASSGGGSGGGSRYGAAKGGSASGAAGGASSGGGRGATSAPRGVDTMTDDDIPF